jgi:hypothetical protein
MHRVRSLLVLVLASTLIALGLVAASPGVAIGESRRLHNQTFTEYSRTLTAVHFDETPCWHSLGSSANVGLALSPGVCQPTLG